MYAYSRIDLFEGSLDSQMETIQTFQRKAIRLVRKTLLVLNCSVFLRHLYCDRSDDMLDKIEHFVQEVIGCGYQINLKKLLFTRNTMN